LCYRYGSCQVMIKHDTVSYHVRFIWHAQHLGGGCNAIFVNWWSLYWLKSNKSSSSSSSSSVVFFF
jgi:hypothetical protein